MIDKKLSKKEKRIVKEMTETLLDIFNAGYLERKIVTAKIKSGLEDGDPDKIREAIKVLKKSLEDF